MRTVVAAFRELVGLFVDDGALALAIIAVVVLAAVVASIGPADHWASGGILVIGCLSVLVVNVMTAKRR